MCLLGRQHARASLLRFRTSRGLQLVTGALGKPLGPDVAEHLVGNSELLAGVDAPVLATQPFAV